MHQLLILLAAGFGATVGLLVPRAAFRLAVEPEEPRRTACPAGHPIGGPAGGWIGLARCTTCAVTPAAPAAAPTPAAPVPGGPIPAGATPTGATPSGPTPTGATPSGPSPADAIPGGPSPAGAIPAAPILTGATPGGPRPAGAIPGGPVPAGAIPAAPVPAGATPGGPSPGGPSPGSPSPAGAIPGGPVPAGATPAAPVPTGATPGGPSSAVAGGLAVPSDAGTSVPADAVPAGTGPEAGPDPGPEAGLEAGLEAGPGPGPVRGGGWYGSRTGTTAVVTALGCAALAAATGARPELAVWLLLTPFAVVLALVDMAVHRLPDVLTLPLAAVAATLLGVAAVFPGDAGSWPAALLGGVALTAGYLVLFLINPNGMGFGDVKLALTLGVALGWYGWAVLLAGTFAAFLIGALYGLGLMLLRRAGRKTAMPFGPFMLFGAFLALVLGGPGP